MSICDYFIIRIPVPVSIGILKTDVFKAEETTRCKDVIDSVDNKTTKQ